MAARDCAPNLHGKPVFETQGMKRGVGKVAQWQSSGSLPRCLGRDKTCSGSIPGLPVRQPVGVTNLQTDRVGGMWPSCFPPLLVYKKRQCGSCGVDGDTHSPRP